jgi:hypothetical protein
VIAAAWLVEAFEAGAAQQTASENGEPLFDGVEPARVTRRALAAKAARRILQPGAARVARVQGFLVGARLAAEVGDAVSGAARSSAWMPLFSSKDTTMCGSGIA